MIAALVNGNGSNFLSRYGWGIVATLIGGLTLAGLSGSVRLWREFTVMQERQAILTQAVSAQVSRFEQSLLSFQQERDMLHLIVERQNTSLKHQEIQNQALATLASQNTEQQYVINLLQERLRLLERLRMTPDVQ